MMNKYEEALDNIGSLYMYDEDGEADCMLSESFMKDDYDILKELVEKATPCKFVKSYSQYGTETWLCPNCRRKLKRAWQSHNHYCPKCGQAIDWSQSYNEE